VKVCLLRRIIKDRKYTPKMKKLIRCLSFSKEKMKGEIDEKMNGV